MNAPNSTSGVPPFDPALHHVYRKGRYLCGDFRLQPGESNARFAEWMSQRGHKTYAFVTAYNPYSDGTTSLPENLARSRVLRKLVEEQGFAHLPAAGVDPAGEWPEEVGVMLFDVALENALKIGIDFKQNAILFGEISGEPAVLWCRCVLRNTK
ncbi:DUF3293 domain-containing protein [Neolewinella antarctica]|uniref:DUF3293 domain-containing protein n=1 Tax=Neolewinella antarctica TaxID=442734 RepID=A0ABX0X842_9BACT|nr:DUF3293 domain-containing protein [Neolewinella antarctica]NJC25144.1 hypothetical protein [Neolewinella antarctica]